MITRMDPDKIARLLTQSTRQIDTATLSALEDARRHALTRQSVHSSVFALTAGRWMPDLIPHSTQQWVAAGLFAAMLVIGTGYWQHSTEQQISDLDVAILTDELPIETLLSDSHRT